MRKNIAEKMKCQKMKYTLSFSHPEEQCEHKIYVMNSELWFVALISIDIKQSESKTFVSLYAICWWVEINTHIRMAYIILRQNQMMKTTL